MISTNEFRAPLYVAWELTHKCNARCLHCYSDSSSDADCSLDLSTKEALNVIDQLADAGVLILAFSGGEPLLRPDWRILVKHAIDRGLSVNIGTNGACVNKTIAEELSTLKIRSVTVSLDSNSPETHDYFRQYPGLFKKAVKAIKLFIKYDIRVVIGFTPTRINWRDGPAVIDLAINLGANAVNLSEYVPAGRGGIDLALDSDQLYNVLNDWIHLREEVNEKIEIIWHDCRVGMLVPKSESQKYKGCGAGRVVARILPDGTVTPCVFLPTSIGSLRFSKFKEIWTDSILLHQFRQRKGYIKNNCGDCEHLTVCGGCRGVSYAYFHGDPLAGDNHCWISKIPLNEIEDLIKGESLPI